MTYDSMAGPDATGAGALAEMGARLAKGREASDAKFTGIGARLQECATVLNGITLAFEALPRELQSDELTDAITRLADLGSRASAITAAFELERASLSALLESIVAVGEPVIDLDKTNRLLGILALNAHVVAADSGGRTTGLATIAQETTQLSDNAADSIKIFRSRYARLVDTARKAVRHQADFEAGHRRTLTDLAADIACKLAELEHHRAGSVGALAQTAQLTREVSNGVTQAVIALQIGDATHQRLSHVEQALATVERMLAGDGSETSAVPPEERPLVAGQVLLLQQRQLEDTRSRLGMEGDALKVALAQLTVRTGEIVQQGKAIGASGGGEQQGSVLADLSAGMRAAGVALRTYERERRKLDAVAGSVISTTDALLKEVETIRRIEHRMRLLSLNATARCAQQQVGAGGFDVIARQLREITMRLVGSANAAMQGLDRAADLAAALTQNSSSAGADRVGEMEDEAVRAINLLEGVEGRLDLALAALAEQGPRAVLDLEAAATALSGANDISALMGEVADELAALPAVEAADPLAMEGPSGEVLATLRRAYTMAVERQVHDALMSDTARAVTPDDGGAASPSQQSEEAVLFF